MDNSHILWIKVAIAFIASFTFVDSVLAEEHEHDYENGFCTYCDGYEPAMLNEDNDSVYEGFYMISNAGQLYWFAEKVNGGETTINGTLTSDIVVNENVLNANGTLRGDGSTFRVWTPIGGASIAYHGLFDGQGHTISGLYFNDETKTHIGLFGSVSMDSKEKNVGVVDNFFHGGNYTAGVCGYGANATLTNCYNTGTVIGLGSVGGICGNGRSATLTNCYNTGTVSGANTVGGVCGDAHTSGAHINNCYYLSGTCGKGVGSGTDKTTAKTDAQFASGEVAWLLNGSKAGENPVWRQTIGEDEYPVLDAKKGIVIYSTQTGLNSVVRPTAGTLVGAMDVYNFAGIDGKKVYGIEHTGTLAAEHPYVFTTHQNYVSFVPSDEEVIDNTETCGLMGVLDPEGITVYGNDDSDDTPVSIVFTADALKYANANGNLVKYGKCYIKASEAFVSSVSLMACPLPVALEGVTTGIDALEVPEADGKCYNLMGIEVGDDYKGIVIVNGKKMVRK